MNNHYLYLLLNIGSIAIPFALSFDKKVHFYTYWKSLFAGGVVMGVIYITWDIFFTHFGIWGFNDDYLTGIYLYKLPLEECLFFVTIPYACIFVYETLRSYLKRDFFESISLPFSWGLIIFLLAGAIYYHDRTYTLVNFLSCAFFIGIHILLFGKRHIGWFYLAFLVCLIPFYLVNGILTSIPVVWYNPDEIIGLRVGTIPFEDHFYNMGMLLCTLTVYEWCNKR